MPEFESSVAPEALPGRANPRLPEEVSPASTGAAIGRGIEDVGDIAQRVYMQAIKTQVTDASNQLQSVAQDLTHNPQTGAFTKQGKDAFGLDQQYLPQYDQHAQQIIDSLPQGLAQTHAREVAAQYRNELASQLDTHELHQHAQFTEQTSKASVSLAQQRAASNYNHPDIIANAVDTADYSLEQLGKTQGWSPEQLEEAKHQSHLQTYTGVVQNMLADGKVGMAKAFIDTVRPELKPVEVKMAEAVIAKGEVDAAVQPIMQAYSANTTLGAQQVVALAHSGLTQDQQYQVIQEVERQRQGLMVQRRQDPRLQAQLSSLEDSIQREKPLPNAPGMVEALWHQGAISDDQRISLHGHIDRLNDKQDEAGAMLQAAKEAYTNHTPLAPNDEKVKKGVDQLFQGLTAAARPGSMEWSNRAVDVATRTGVIPKTAVEYATANLVSGQPPAAAASADMLARVDETNPRAMEFVDEKTRVMADSISRAVRAGTPADVAVDMARKVGALSKYESEGLKQRWEAIKPSQQQPGALTTILKSDPSFRPHFWSDVPAVPAAMQGEFDGLTHQYFDLTGGNINQARQLAARDLKRTWGATEVNGKKEIMQYAPEQMFPGLSPLVVRQDIEKTVGDNPQAFQRFNANSGKLEDAKPAPADIRLIATDHTARTNGAEWNLGAPDEYGALDVLRGPAGVPLVYRLPVGKNDFAAVQQRLAEAAMAKAREKQAARAARDPDPAFEPL